MSTQNASKRHRFGGRRNAAHDEFSYFCSSLSDRKYVINYASAIPVAMVMKHGVSILYLGVFLFTKDTFDLASKGNGFILPS